jgi:hypothetical protein
VGIHPHRGFESPPLRSTDPSEYRQGSKSAENQEVTSTGVDDLPPSITPVEVPADDSPNTIEVTTSDKLDNKPDSDLSEIVAAWPELPATVRAAIVMLVRASGEGSEDCMRRQHRVVSKGTSQIHINEI